MYNFWIFMQQINDFYGEEIKPFSLTTTVNNIYSGFSKFRENLDD